MLQTSYEAKTKDLWVFIETKDGKARNVGLELLNPGRRLAGIQGGKTVALVIGYNCDEAVKEAIAHGADKVLVVDNEVYDHYSTDAYTAAIVHCVEADCPTTILMGASPMGRDLGPRVAGRLKTGLTADCTSLDIDEATGKVAWTRPAFGGNLMATILCPFTFPQIGTCRPGVNKKLEADYSRTAEVEKVDFVFPADQIRIKVIETIAEEGEKVDLEGADIIVSGGRGLGGPEGFDTTIRIGKMTYYSRSRQELWTKGMTSGHIQYLKSLTADCDYDTILAKVSQVGGIACHTGNPTCFFNDIVKKEYSEKNPLKIFEDVYDIILDRKAHPKEGSYTNYLFDKGIDKILKKVGEEATEIVIAAKNPDNEEIKYEISDFLYHVMVLMAEKGVTWEDITGELSQR